jgi:hypothetical protein
VRISAAPFFPAARSSTVRPERTDSWGTRLVAFSFARLAGATSFARLAGATARVAVPLLDQQPLLARRPALRLHPDERPAAAQLVAEQVEEDLALPQRLLWIADDRPPAPVPDDRLARPVVAVRDHALEVGVLDRVVLGLDRQALVGRVGGGALRDRPRLEDASPLQPEVVVEPSRRMFLNHEEMRASGRRRCRRAPGVRSGERIRRYFSSGKA